MPWTRREILKGLGGIPILGAAWTAGSIHTTRKRSEKAALLEKLQIDAAVPRETGPMDGDAIRVGIVGFGIRGKQLCRSLGFATNDWLLAMKDANAANSRDTRLSEFLDQEDLNVKLTGICDVFDVQAQIALDSFSTEDNRIKRYRTHTEMIESGEIDAIIIATPDHWHAPMAIDALKAGIHVYVEKPMTHTIAETYELKAAAENTRAVFAVGHQHRQTQSFLTAREIVNEGVLGHVSLISTHTNRNDDNGAWQYDIHQRANAKSIDWDLFLGPAPNVPFNKEHFFRWRKWWAYGSGLSGDLMTHDYDRLNCVLNMGIPRSVTASGGIYTHKDGRNVPDVMQINMEFPNYTTGTSQKPGKEGGMTFVYSATLGNQYSRPTVLMGHDGTMELGNRLTVWADRGSTRYAQLFEEERISPNVPIYQYDPAADAVDGVTSATAQYFADKGLLWTYVDGKRVDSTFLHLREWLSCIRNGGSPSCGIKEGFDEAISAHMGGLAYKLDRTIYWDHKAQEIVPIPGIDLDEVLLKNQEKYQMASQVT